MPLPFQPVPNTVEATVKGTYDGQLVENKFYAQATATITSAMVAAIAGVVEDWVHNTMLALVPSIYTHIGTVARDLSAPASFETINDTHGGEIGGITGSQPLPGNVTLAVHRVTNFSGKKQKSRVYWPGLTLGALTDVDTVSTGTAAALIVALETLRTNILADTSATWSYGYPQRIINGIRIATANFIEVVNHGVTDLFVDSMRRRLKGRGV